MFSESLRLASERDREGYGTPLQSSCLENPMDGGAWWATVHGVAKNRTRGATEHTRTRGRTHSWIRHILSGSLSFPRKQKQLKSNQIFQISLRVSLGLSDTATDNHNTDPGWWLWWWAPGSSRLGQASPKHAWSPRTQGSCLPHTLCPLPSSAWALRGNRIRSPV